jgi:ankyrin repeat protein
MTPLLRAAVGGYDTVVKMLLQEGAKTEARDRDENATALIWAARMGHKEVVGLLLDAGADREAEDKDGKSALSWAEKPGFKRIEQMLLKGSNLVDEA